jgi:tryptophan-rich hypothetical protein
MDSSSDIGQWENYSARRNAMARVSPKKLLHSKWTRVQPLNREKHFLINDVEYDEDGNVILCIIEAIINKREFDIDWRELNDDAVWRAGWG